MITAYDFHLKKGLELFNFSNLTENPIVIRREKDTFDDGGASQLLRRLCLREETSALAQESTLHLTVHAIL